MRERGAEETVDCPLHFTDAEKAAIEQDMLAAFKGMEAMKDIRDAMGDGFFPAHGVVKPEDYDKVKDMLRQVKRQVKEHFARDDDERAAWDRSWPWDD